MSKRLIMILALAFVVGLACAAYAEVQNVKVSGDLTVYGISRKMVTSPTQNNTETAMASVTRVKIDADLTDNVMATVRLLNERYWGREVDNTGGAGAANDKNSDIDLDLAYVTMKEFLYSPLTLTIGRQELHFGNDMIVGDRDTNNAVTGASAFNGVATAWPRDPDLSARKAFDAIRATLNYDPMVVDLVVAQVLKGTLNTDTSENLYGVNANYALNKKNNLEAYWFERRRGLKTGTNNKVDTTHNLGGRIVSRQIENLTYQLEVAFQLGTRVNALGAAAPTQKRRAWALETAATYDLKNVKRIAKYSPTLTMLYSYFSGNRGSDKANSAWDPMYENQTSGNIVNLLFPQSNAHVLGGIATAKLVEDVTLKGEYYAYWWDKVFSNGVVGAGQVLNPGSVLTGDTLTMTDSKFAGQEIDLTATYDYTEDVQFSLMGGIMIPGASFKNIAPGNNGSRSAASEVIGSMKVTF